MKLNQITYFREVCRWNNISKAAQTLFVSQPAISSAIKELEEEFGVALFFRNNNKLVLTPEGEFFYQRVKNIISDVETIETQMKNMGDIDRRLRIGVPPMIGIVVFPLIFNRYTKECPEVQIEIAESGSLEIRHYVLEDRVDFALSIIDKDLSKQFEIRPLYNTELVFCVSRTHHLANEKRLSFKMLKDEKLILMKADAFQHPQIMNRFSELEFIPNVLVYSNQLTTIEYLVRNGNAGAFLFKEIVDARPDLVGIPLDVPIKIHIGIIWKRNRFLNKDAVRFIQMAESDFKINGNQD